MIACVALYAILCAISECVTVHRHFTEPDTNKKEELPPLLISCKLNDIVTIFPPIKNVQGTLYYLHRPNGDVTQLNITRNHEENFEWNTDKYKVTNVNPDNKTLVDMGDMTFEDDDIVIGPVMEEDHGNWVLSVYQKIEREWKEWFQVISIEIIEDVPLKALPELNVGDTAELSFAYPIKHLQSCQLLVPPSTNDRSYDRVIDDTCSFIVRNITTDDSGAWQVLGVGRIVYSAKTFLKVKNKIT